jgi:hypothetical protein
MTDPVAISISVAHKGLPLAPNLSTGTVSDLAGAT